MTILAMSMGMVVASGLLGKRAQSSANVKKRQLSRCEFFWVVVFVLICVAVLVVYLMKVPSIAILTALKEGFVAGQKARSQMGNDFVGKYHWYKLFMRDGLFLATFVLYANWLIKVRKGMFDVLFFFATFFITIFSVVSATEKGPVVTLIVGMFLVYVIVKRGGTYPLKGVLTIGVFVFTALVAAYVNFMGSMGIFSAIKSIFSRAFTGQITPAYWYLEYFPQFHDFLAGRSFPNPMGILPFENYRLSVEIMNYFHPDILNSGVVGSAPTVYWAEMYANFGVIGVVVSPFFVGIALCWIASLLNKLENTSLKVGLIVAVAMHFKSLNGTGLSGFIIDTYFLGILGFVFVILALGNYGRIKLLCREVVQ